MNQRTIILIASILFAVSAAFLFWQNERELDPNLGKSWWTLAFADPHAASPDFTVKNYGEARSFSYQMFLDGSIAAEERFEMEIGDTRTVRPTLPEGSGTESVRILVTDGAGTKEIYR